MSEADHRTQVREKGFVAATSVAAGIFLTVVKLAIGLLTGSLGLLAEAAHSALDFGAAVITYFAVRVSDRPADESHLYGHGKVENLSALAETVLLLVTCGWIIYEAINRLFFEHVNVELSAWAFLAIGVSIAVDYSRSRALRRAANKYQSQALEADALHFSTDIWSSAVVALGLGFVWLGERIGRKEALVHADAVAALVVALIVIYVSVQLGHRAIDALLDRAPADMAERIVGAVQDVDDVRRVNRARVRGSGSQVFVDLRVAVPRHLSFEESHAVTQRVQDAVHSVVPEADVVIHTVPVAENEGVLETIQAVARRGRCEIHNITTRLTVRGLWIDLDMEVPPDLSLDEAHTRATDLEDRLRAELDGDASPSAGARDGRAGRIADINVHIEPRAQELLRGSEMAAGERAVYVERIDAACAATPHAHSCRDIEVQRLGNEVYLAFHVVVDSDLSVAQVHGISEDIENRLRREFPELGRVMVHAEPR